MSSMRRLSALGSVCLLAASLTTPSSAAPGLFALPQLHPVGNHPMDLAVGHLDGDGLPDVVVVNRTSQDLSVIRNVGNPNAVELRIAIGGSTRSVAVGDLNGDGLADIAVGREGSAPTVLILAGRGDGTFDPPLAAGDLDVFPDALWIGDLDGDSDRDLVVASAPSNRVVVLIGDGDGEFVATPYEINTSPAYPSDLAVGDADGDGDLDLLVTASLSPQPPRLLLNHGNGAFAPYVTFTEVVATYVSAAVGNLAGNGAAELTLLDFGGSRLAVFPNGGGGAFGQPEYFSVGASTQFGGRVRLGDLDGDGHLDAVVGLGLQNPAIPVLLGDGTGGFGAAESYPAATGISGIALVDLDVDGDLDVVATARDANVLVVLHNLMDPTTAVLGDGWSDFQLAAPRPNPGRAPTIAFSLPAPAHVRLTVHDVAGRTIASLVNGPRAAGEHQVVWEGTAAGGERVAAGVYYLRLVADGHTRLRTVALKP